MTERMTYKDQNLTQKTSLKKRNFENRQSNVTNAKKNKKKNISFLIET